MLHEDLDSLFPNGNKMSVNEIIVYAQSKKIFQLNLVSYLVRNKGLTLKEANELVDQNSYYAEFKESNELLKKDFFES